MTRDIWSCVSAYFFIGGVFAAFMYKYTRNFTSPIVVFFLWPVAMLFVAVVAVIDG